MTRTARLTETIRIKMDLELLASLEASARENCRGLHNHIRYILRKVIEVHNSPAYRQRVKEVVDHSVQAARERQVQARRKQFRVLTGSPKKKRIP